MINNKTTDRALLFLGGGHMAAVIIRSLLKHALLPVENIAVIGRSRNHLAQLQDQLDHQLQVFTSADQAIPRCDTVILAVPPQAISNAIHDNRNSIPQDALVISVCAGVTIAELQSLLDRSDADAVFSCPRFDNSTNPRVIRVMPNTLSSAEHGYSAICPSSESTEEDIAYVEALFRCLGPVRRIQEDMFDAFTAFSCTGPAYVLEFITSMIEAGMKAGLSEAEARSFILENLLGTGRILQEENEDPAAMLDRMCTPGGITIAAMGSLSAGGFADLIDQAVQAGIHRAKELRLSEPGKPGESGKPAVSIS